MKGIRRYRALGSRTLLVQLAVLSVAELVLFRAYQAQQAGFHWATHLLVALTAAAFWNLGWLLAAAAPAPGQLLSFLVFHLYAMFPDLLFATGVPHRQWMDVFLGHLLVHYLPGRERAWLAIGLAASGLYAAALAASLRASRRSVSTTNL